jgi:hypothetical protein
MKKIATPLKSGARNDTVYAQALLRVGFGFIIRHSHRAFFAIYFSFLVVGIIAPGHIFFVSS